MKQPYAYIILENSEVITIELRPDCAPNTVNSFVFLTHLGIYRDHSIERIVPGYVVDASYSAFHREEAKYLIPNEAGTDPLLPVPGTICMGGYDGLIAGGEFFFPLVLSEKIRGRYPVFGHIRKGLDFIMSWEHIELVPVTVPSSPGIEINAPKEPIIIRDIIIEANGHSFEEPVRINDAPLPDCWK